MAKTEHKSRRFIFVIPNYTEEELEHVHELAASLKKHRYINYGLELGETNFPHIQAYIEFKEAQRFFFLHKYLNIMRNGELLKFHIEIANGTAEENKEYDCKEGDFYEFGEPITQGARTDLSEIKEAVKANPKNLVQIIDEHANNQQQLRFAESLQRYYLPHRDSATPPKVFWIYGRTGIGKTKLVFDTFTDVCSVSDYQWIGTGYSQNECLLFDDFREFNLSFEQLLKITDRYQHTLFFKGGSIPLNSPYIIFTSPQGLTQTFRNIREDLDQLFRRVTEIDLDMASDVSAVDLRNYPKGA